MDPRHPFYAVGFGVFIEKLFQSSRRVYARPAVSPNYPARVAAVGAASLKNVTVVPEWDPNDQDIVDKPRPTYANGRSCDPCRIRLAVV